MSEGEYLIANDLVESKMSAGINYLLELPTSNVADTNVPHLTTLDKVVQCS